MIGKMDKLLFVAQGQKPLESRIHEAMILEPADRLVEYIQGASKMFAQPDPLSLLPSFLKTLADALTTNSKLTSLEANI